MNSDKIPMIFANCIPVKGAYRSSIIDLQHNECFLIPNGLYTILTKYKGLKIDEIKSHFDDDDKIVIDEYFDFLNRNKLLFFVSNVDLYPELSTDFNFAGEISNAIIEVDFSLSYGDYEKLIFNLDALGAKAVQIRFKGDKVTLSKVYDLMAFFNTTAILDLEIVIEYGYHFSTTRVQELIDKYPRISSVNIYKHAEKLDYTYNQVPVRFCDYNFSNMNCGVFNQNSFIINEPFYFESQLNNSCLNKKISVDAQGNIRNCISLPNKFGNIKDTTLDEALNKPGFKKYWNIPKDKIEVCKDCEFRYICVDCRAYTEAPDDMFSKPLKCGYDPYSGEWSEWSTNPLKLNAIQYYELQELKNLEKSGQDK